MSEMIGILRLLKRERPACSRIRAAGGTVGIDEEVVTLRGLFGNSEHQDKPMTLLFKVEDVFDIQGRGCVLAPATDPTPGIRPGDRIQLRIPADRILDTHIASVEFVHGKTADGSRFCRTAVMLPREISKEDIPIGTEVWLL